MAKSFTVQEFFKRLPDNDTCLDHLMKVRHGESVDSPKSERHGKFHRVK